MSETPRLSLPFIAAAQAQKHVTHNDALMHLDAVIHIAVVSRSEPTPPASPAEGELRHIGASPEGAFAGHAGQIAERRDGGWLFHAPQAGWVMWVEAEGLLLVFDGTTWRGIVDGGRPDALQTLGLGTKADTANPFAAKLNKALWTARETEEGGDGDLRMTFNKQASGGVLSLLFQSGYSGRAEIGLVGDDDLQLRVSANGSTWREALRIDGASGALRLPAGNSAAPPLTPAGDSNTGFFFPAADTVAVSTGGSENLRFVPGQILISTQASLGPSQAPSARVQIAGTAASNSSVALGRFSANAGSASFNFLKSRAVAPGSFAAVGNNDLLGSLHFDGDTGGAFELGARISAAADGTPSVGSMPTRLVFATSAAGSATPVERLRIASTGVISFPAIATTASGSNAFLDGGAGNGLYRSTSSRRYKRDIEPLDPSIADRVLDLKPVYYRSAAARDPAGWSWYGLIAEEVAEIDPRLVHWGHQEHQYEPAGDDDGAERPAGLRLRPGAELRPDAVQYDRLSVLLIDVIRRQRAALASLESRMSSLEKRRRRSAVSRAAPS